MDLNDKSSLADVVSVFRETMNAALSPPTLFRFFCREDKKIQPCVTVAQRRLNKALDRLVKDSGEQRFALDPMRLLTIIGESVSKVTKFRFVSGELQQIVTALPEGIVETQRYWRLHPISLFEKSVLKGLKAILAAYRPSAEIQLQDKIEALETSFKNILLKTWSNCSPDRYEHPIGDRYIWEGFMQSYAEKHYVNPFVPGSIELQELREQHVVLAT